MDPSRLTVAQLKEAMTKLEISFPSNIKKVDLIDRLVKFVGGPATKDASPGPSAAPDKKRKMEADVGSSSKMFWMVTTETLHDSYGERESQDVGAYDTKEAAIQNAKIAFANLDNCDSCFDKENEFNEELAGDAGWEDWTDNSDNLGEKGGVLFMVQDAEGGENMVRVKPINLNKPVKKNRY